jgi:hypothetical protein
MQEFSDFTGRPMKGFLYVKQKALKSAPELNHWLKQCLAFVDSLPAKKK